MGCVHDTLCVDGWGVWRSVFGNDILRGEVRGADQLFSDTARLPQSTRIACPCAPQIAAAVKQALQEASRRGGEGSSHSGRRSRGERARRKDAWQALACVVLALLRALWVCAAA